MLELIGFVMYFGCFKKRKKNLISLCESIYIMAQDQQWCFARGKVDTGSANGKV